MVNPIDDGSSMSTISNSVSNAESTAVETKQGNGNPTEADETPQPNGAEANSKGDAIDDPGLKSNWAIRPMVRQRHEASELELFFDLFFVANLTTFTVRDYPLALTSNRADTE